MGQILHGSAKTTRAIRTAIQRSKASIQELAEPYDLNPKTVAKSTSCILETGRLVFQVGTTISSATLTMKSSSKKSPRKTGLRH